MGALIGAAVSIAWECAVAVVDVIVHGFGVCGAIGS